MAWAEHTWRAERVADAGRRIDEVAAQANDARLDTRIRVERRVVALRGHLARIDASLDRIDTDVQIAVAQLALDNAGGRRALAAAVEAQILAHQDNLARLDARAERSDEVSSARLVHLQQTIRVQLAVVTERLDQLALVPDDALALSLAGLLTALDNIVRAEDEARGSVEDDTDGRHR